MKFRTIALMVSTILSFAEFSFATGTSSSTCNETENKFVFSNSSEFGGRVLFENLELCLAGKRIAIFGSQRDFVIGYRWRDYTSGLCRALGFGRTVSTDGRFLKKPERLATFDVDGKLEGVQLVNPWRDHQSEHVVTSATCDPLN